MEFKPSELIVHQFSNHSKVDIRSGYFENRKMRIRLLIPNWAQSHGFTSTNGENTNRGGVHRGQNRAIKHYGGEQKSKN